VDLTGRYSNPRDPLRRLAELESCTDDGYVGAPTEAGAASRRPVQRRLKPDDVTRLVTEYRAGATARELAQRFGIHRTTVSAQLESACVPIRKGGLQSDQVDEVVRLYEMGWSARQLSKRFRVSDHTIAAELRKAGVQIRSR
jgi:transposase